jgi:hypothetical protein
MSNRATILLDINGHPHRLALEPRVTLLDALHEVAVDRGANRYKIELAPRVVARAILKTGEMT